MAKMTKRELNATMAKLVKANNTAVQLQAKIAEHCLEVYGVEPGDVDCEEIVDRLGAGCGMSEGMNADEFDRAMRESIDRRKNI